MAYKVLIINGSPRPNGCTATALGELISTLHQEGIETELLQVGAEAIRGCTACGYCRTHDGCVFQDALRFAHAPQFLQLRAQGTCTGDKSFAEYIKNYFGEESK